MYSLHGNGGIAFTNPKSVCTCGHRGDGCASDHAGVLGHGRCLYAGCKCTKFTWKRWTHEFERYIRKTRGK